MYLCSRMIADFVRYLEAERRYSPLTVRNYRHDVEQFLAWLGVDDARFEPQRITTDDIREWILYRTETGRVSAASMNREISSLRALFRWLLRTGAVSRDVVHPIPSLRTSQRLPAFVPESRMSGIVSECECDSEDFVRERNSLIDTSPLHLRPAPGGTGRHRPQRFLRGLLVAAHPGQGRQGANSPDARIRARKDFTLHRVN